MADGITEPHEPAEPQNPQSSTEPQEPTEPQPQTEPHGEPVASVDWKAKARLWEGRAKENKAAADQAAAELAKTKLALQVSHDTGVPIALIHGDTEEEMAASAKAASEWAAAMAPSYPADKGGSASAAPVTRESIDRIKDPLARLHARAANANLYQ